MRTSLLLLVAAAAALPSTGCPATTPNEPESESSAGETGTTTAPTDTNETQIMTSDNSMGTTVTPTSDATTTTGEPASTSDTGESTGSGGPIVVEGLASPESILHDKEADIYLISNINGAAEADDDDGFISRVLPDGEIDELRWIDGADPEVTLSAPKGMAILGDVLYVADITRVHKFDRVTGAQLATIPIDGAMFLNDLAASPIGRVYVSDTYANSLHFLDTDDSVTTLLTSPDLTGPNGLLFAGDFLTVVGFNGPNMFNVPFEGANANVIFTFEFGSLDGIVAVPDGLLVSTWEDGSAGVYKLASDLVTVTPVVEGIGSPADIEVDASRSVLLVPVLEDNRAEFYPL